MQSKIPQISANTFAIHWQASSSYDELVRWIRELPGTSPKATDREIRKYLSNKAAGLRKKGLPLKSYRPRRIAEQVIVLDPEAARQVLAAQKQIENMDGAQA